MEKSQRLFFLDIVINKSGTKIWMDILNRLKTICPIYVKLHTALFNK